MARVSEQTSCDNPKVSVVMITYNHAKFIAQAIESVLMQETDFQIELIIGEDCSTDNTRQIVKAFADKFPNVIRALLPERNLGMQRNVAVVSAACRGQYMAYLEGDDYWTCPNKLQRQFLLMEANPRFSMCGCATRIIADSAKGGEEDAGLIQPKSVKPNYNLADFLSGYPLHTSSILIRRGLVVIPSWMDNVTNLDTCIFALYAEKGPVGYINEVTSCKRMHSGGIWTSKSLIEKTKCSQKTFDLLDSHFGGKYRYLIKQWEFCNMMATSRLLVEHELAREARLIYWEAVSRLGRVMPFRMVSLGFAVYGGIKLQIAWSRVTMFLAVRTRLRRMISPTRTH